MKQKTLSIALILLVTSGCGFLGWCKGKPKAAKEADFFVHSLYRILTKDTNNLAGYLIAREYKYDTVEDKVILLYSVLNTRNEMQGAVTANGGAYRYSKEGTLELIGHFPLEEGIQQVLDISMPVRIEEIKDTK